MGRSAAQFEFVRQDWEVARASAERVLEEHLRRLAGAYDHGNRKLHYDDLLLGLIFAFFEPLARSLRTIQDAGDFGGKLDLPCLARSTTSDAFRVFDPALLEPLIADLLARAPHLKHLDEDLRNITRQIIAADGTYFSTLSDVAWALQQRKSDGKMHGQVRANVQMNVANWIPRLSISGDDGGSEAQAFVPDLQEGVIYVLDRNFLEFSFLVELLKKNNDFVLRIRANAPKAEVQQSRAIGEEDAAAGVVADEVVKLTGLRAPQGLYRRVTIHTTNRQGEPEVIQLLSSLTDERIPPRVIGTIYRQRWQIELFFRWLKCWAGMDHLLSTSREGITFQLYVAVIAVLLIAVQTGRRVSRYSLVALSYLSRGLLTLEEAMEVIERRAREAERERARQAAKRAAKKSA